MSLYRLIVVGFIWDLAHSMENLIFYYNIIIILLLNLGFNNNYYNNIINKFNNKVINY